MDNQLKRFSYKYRKIQNFDTAFNPLSLGHSFDPLYLTHVIYMYYSTPGLGIKEGEQVVLTIYKPLDEKTITNQIHNRIEFDD